MTHKSESVQVHFIITTATHNTDVKYHGFTAIGNYGFLNINVIYNILFWSLVKMWIYLVQNVYLLVLID